MLDKFENIYFVGIGGIGMSAIARYFKSQGKNVAGYDKTPTELTAELEKEGIDIHFRDAVECIPTDFKQNNTLVIYTPAIPADFKELYYFKICEYKLIKRSEALGIISKDKFNIAVAGTHGKTSISTTIAHILKNSLLDCSAFLGGIAKNYNSNLLISDKINAPVVEEADEYDKSFLQLSPNIAIISSTDADHLDIYQNKENLVDNFNLFANKIKQNGILIIKKGLPIKDIRSDIKYFTYSLQDKEADYYAENIREKDGSYYFDFISADITIKNISLSLPFITNVENSIVAIAVAINIGVKEEELRLGLSTFKGVKRRFDYQINSKDIVFIDDYAHHPEELKAIISSVKLIYPDKNILGIFQPHLFTRTRDFADGFAESLSKLSEVILLDIYPAREEEIEGISSKIIFDKITLQNKTLITSVDKDNRLINNTKDVLNIIKNQKNEVILSLGAGDIDVIVPKIKSVLLDNPK